MKLRVFARQSVSVALIFLPIFLVIVKPFAMLVSSAEPLAFLAQILLIPILFAGPGLALMPFVRQWMPATISGKIAWIMLLSLFVSAFVPWGLYFLGVYTVAAAQTFVVLLYLSLAFGLARFPWRSTLRTFSGGIESLSWPDKLGLAFCTWFFAFSTIRSFEAFSAWDALVSWDKWGRDMASRQGLGRYVMGAYPQLVPALYSVFYKVFATTDPTAIPDTTYVVHGLNGAFDWFIIPGSFVLCRKLRASFLLFVAIFLGSGVFIGWFASGYVDTATTAVFLCTAALAAEWTDEPTRTQWKAAFLWFVPAAATLCFIKGQGSVLMLFVALFVGWWSHRGTIKKAGAAIRALLCGALIALPYTIQQHRVWSAGRAETDILLHSMPIRAAHPELVTRTWVKASSLAREFLTAYQLPVFKEPHAYAMIGLVLLVVALILSLRKRHVIPVAIAAVVGWGIWFWSSSYDWRNANQVAALTALCMAAGLNFEIKKRRIAVVATILQCLIALGISGHAFIFLKTTSVFALPTEWRLAPMARPSALCGPQFDLLNLSPLTKETRHLFTQNVDVWLLGDKAVYLWHPFAHAIVPEASDVAVVFRNQEKNLSVEFRESFEPISNFTQQQIRMVEPRYSKIDALLSAQDKQTTPVSLPVEINESGIYALDACISVSGGDVVLYKVEIEDAASSAISIVIGREWSAFTSYRNICSFVRDGNAFKALFWLDRIPSGTLISKLPPIALVKDDDKPLTVKSESIQILKAEVPLESSAQ